LAEDSNLVLNDLNVYEKQIYSGGFWGLPDRGGIPVFEIDCQIRNECYNATKCGGFSF
jgi:hypothetical protein